MRRKAHGRFLFPTHARGRRHASPYLLLWGVGLACTSGVCQKIQVGSDVRTPATVKETPVPAGLDPQSQAGEQAETDGRLQLSLQQAVRMALENNLDIKLEQLDQSVADFSLARTKGGGTPRPINYNVAETPVGEGTSAMPILASTGSPLSPNGIQPSGITVPSSYDVGHVLEGQHSLSIAAAPFSAGAPIPAFDLSLLGQFGWLHRNPGNAVVTSASATTGDTTVTDNTLGNTTLVKGFSSGTSIQLGINNFVQSFYSGRSSAVPFTRPNAIVLIAQPLLRGAGRANNTRYIAIAKTNKKISEAILKQQMISTVSGVENLYFDLIGLQNSVTVQESALKTANELLSGNRQQLSVGNTPSIEVARSEAFVAASQLALTQAVARREQQENVLRSVLDPKSLSVSTAKLAVIVATDEFSSPQDEPSPSVAELIEHAWQHRPDIQQSKLQVSNGERAVAGAANARLPEIDLYGSFQSRGVIIPSNIPISGDAATGTPLLDPVPAGGVRASRVFEAGIQFNFSVQNRVAEADLGADRAELRQERLRLSQMQAQAAAEVRNAVIGLGAAKQALQAAAAAKRLQQQLLAAEVEKFRAGFSTNFNVIQQQNYLVQAEMTEIAAQSSWKKAGVQLDRALGDTLQKQGIDMNVDAAKAVGAARH